MSNEPTIKQTAETKSANAKAPELSPVEERLFAVISGVAHELRTPLGGIVGLNELLMSSGLHNEQLIFAQNIHSSAQSMLAILSDIVEMGKIEAHKVELIPIKFAVAAWLAEFMFSLENSPLFRHIKVSSEVDPNVPQILDGDASRLKQAISNLIIVASKFTEAGSISLKISVANETESSIHLKFRLDAPNMVTLRDGQPILSLLTDDSVVVKRYDSVWMRLHTTKRLIQMMQGTTETLADSGHPAVELVIPFPAAD